jgi:hypothetical protein
MKSRPLLVIWLFLTQIPIFSHLCSSSGGGGLYGVRMDRESHRVEACFASLGHFIAELFLADGTGIEVCAGLQCVFALLNGRRHRHTLATQT